MEKVPCGPVDRLLIRLQKFLLPPCTDCQEDKQETSRTHGHREGRAFQGSTMSGSRAQAGTCPQEKDAATPTSGRGPRWVGLVGDKMSSPRPPLANEVLFAKIIIIALSME